VSKPPRFTIGLDARPRIDHQRRVALEYRRHGDRVDYFAFEPAGLQLAHLPSAEFDARFRGRLIPAVPLSRTAADMLRMAREDYLPGDGVHQLLTEIYAMATTNGTGDYESLDMKGLMAVYNDLAKATGKPPVKEFKSKAEAVKRIKALSGEASKPTPEQEARRKEKADAASAAFDRMAATASNGGADPAAKAVPKPTKRPQMAKPEEPKEVRFPAAAKKAAEKAAKKAGEQKERGPGIGKFCFDLIGKGKTNDEILAAVRKQFPDAKTSAASVAWYRNKLNANAA
jgi:hypothetical protein